MIETGTDGRVRTVTLSRPDVRNALTIEGLESLAEVVESTDEPVCYLDGAGPAFCSGADLTVLGTLDREEAVAFARLGQRVARTIEESETVVVAGVDGPALGGGLELALACDLRVATPGATFGEPGVSFGLFGAWGGTRRLPRVVGEGEALDLALSGRVIDAAAALRMGLVSRIEAEPRRVADEIAAHPPDTVSVLSRRIRDDRDRAPQERAEAEAFGELFAAHADEVDAALE